MVNRARLRTFGGDLMRFHSFSRFLWCQINGIVAYDACPGEEFQHEDPGVRDLVKIPKDEEQFQRIPLVRCFRFTRLFTSVPKLSFQCSIHTLSKELHMSRKSGFARGYQRARILGRQLKIENASANEFQFASPTPPS